VPLHERRDIELRLLDDLNLANVTVLDGEDEGRLPFDLFPGGAGDKGLDQRLKVSLPRESRHGVDHLCAYAAHLGGLGIARFLDLIFLLLSKGNAEHSHDVPVGGAGVYVRLNDALLLLDETAELIAGHVHAVEVEKAVVPLDILDAKLDLAVRHGLVIIKVAQRQFDDSPAKSLARDLGTLGLSDDGLAAFLLGEDGGGDQLVPLLLREGINGLLLTALLRLGESLILTLLF